MEEYGRSCKRSRRTWYGVVAGAASCLAALVVLGAQTNPPAQAGQQGQAPPAGQTPPAGGGPGRGGGRGGQPTGQVLGPNGELWGFSNTAFNPGQRWRIHDPDRPQPPLVAPAATVGAPPSDAIVLFDGKDLSRWALRSQTGELTPAPWAVHDGIFESGRGGSISTRDSFGDIQLHIEFATPLNVEGTSQGRGNSGVIFMGKYEIQVLDSYANRTYADGMAASIYGEWPPLVNMAKKPGEWQTYDIVFEAPKFTGLPSPGYFTVFWNGVVVHNRRQLLGPTSATMTEHVYTAHEAELPLSLQNHGNPVRFRNIWARRLSGYDQSDKK